MVSAKKSKLVEKLIEGNMLDSRKRTNGKNVKQLELGGAECLVAREYGRLY